MGERFVEGRFHGQDCPSASVKKGNSAPVKLSNDPVKVLTSSCGTTVSNQQAVMGGVASHILGMEKICRYVERDGEDSSF